MSERRRATALGRRAAAAWRRAHVRGAPSFGPGDVLRRRGPPCHRTDGRLAVT